MSTLFSGPKKAPPTLSAAQVESERRRILAEQKNGGRAGTILTGGAGITAPILGKSTSLIGGGV